MSQRVTRNAKIVGKLIFFQSPALGSLFVTTVGGNLVCDQLAPKEERIHHVNCEAEIAALFDEGDGN